MKRAIFCIVCCLTSLRGASKCLGMLGDAIGGRAPSWTSVQNWVLRFGLYILTRPVPRRNDWVVILDQAINLGTKKLLLVLAVSLETLRKNEFKLRHQDMRVVAISIEEHCDGERVAAVLEEVSGRVGCIVQAVNDGGSNLKKGIREFQKSHPGVVATSDITHATALLLKNKFECDRRLLAFTNKVTEVRRLVAQTEFACVAPPKPRDKSRWQNLDLYLSWAERIQTLRAAPSPPGRPSKKQAVLQAKRERLFGWLDGFGPDMAEWKNCLTVLNRANTMVKRDGLGRASADNFCRLLATEVGAEASSKMAKNVTTFLRDQGAALPDENAWLGCSDIIESIFGKYKLFTSRTPLAEMGKAVLIIPAMTAELCPWEIAKAMATISTADVNLWLAKNVGKSLVAQRIKLLGTKSKVKLKETILPKAAGF